MHDAFAPPPPLAQALDVVEDAPEGLARVVDTLDSLKRLQAHGAEVGPAIHAAIRFGESLATSYTSSLEVLFDVRRRLAQ